MFDNSILLALPIQFVMGIIIGFFSDDDNKITWGEAILTTGVFVLVNGIAYVMNPNFHNLSVLSWLFIGWLAVWFGLYTGNMLHSEVKRRILTPWFESIAKKEIQIAISDFLKTATKCVSFKSYNDCDILSNKLITIESKINNLIIKFKKLDHIEIVNRFEQINDLCLIYHELVQILIKSDKDPEIMEEWYRLGSTLEYIARDSLNYAEGEIKNKIYNGSLRQVKTLIVVLQDKKDIKVGV